MKGLSIRIIAANCLSPLRFVAYRLLSEWSYFTGPRTIIPGNYPENANQTAKYPEKFFIPRFSVSETCEYSNGDECELTNLKSRDTKVNGSIHSIDLCT